MITPNIAIAVCRFAHDLSLVLLWGGTAFLAWLVPRELADRIGQRMHAPAMAAIAVAIGSGLAILPVETALVGDGWADALNPSVVRDMLFDTSVGRGWQMQTAASLLLPVAALTPWKIRLRALSLASGLCLCSLALTGHAVMQDGVAGALHIGNDMLHLLAGGGWLGALIPLPALLGMLRAESSRRPAATALRRFSNAGHVAVGVVIATGIVNTALVLGRLPTQWTSPYQALLALKILAVTLMAALALVNRYVLVPRLGCRPGGALAALRLATIAEIGLGIGAIGCVAIFGMMEPV